MIRICLQKPVTTMFTFHDRILTDEMVEIAKDIRITIVYPKKFSFGEAERTAPLYYILTHLDEFEIFNALGLTYILKGAIHDLKVWKEFVVRGDDIRFALKLYDVDRLMQLFQDLLTVCQENPDALIETIS